MRRENKLFIKNETLALLNDCVYYCFQNYQITEKESIMLENFLEYLDKEVLEV